MVSEPFIAKACAPCASAEGAFGLYVHWPFCAAKCPYCDFNSHVPKSPIDETAYENAYLAELSYWADEMIAAGTEPPPLSSIFIGGGTPSLMAPSLVEAILRQAEALWGFADDIEITLEANPQSVDAENFKALRMAGVNRLSIGVQSFDDAALKALGRLHNAAEARAAIETAQEAFDRFSFDLIYARPGQSLDDWQAELVEALKLGAKHLSLYQLTVEPNTTYQLLYDAGKLKLPDQDIASDFYALAQELCGAAGLPSYEVSNHAVPGEEARHNLLYWRYGAYLGIGPGAHGRVVLGGARLATQTEMIPHRWLARVRDKGHGGVAASAIPYDEQALEMLLMGMRLKEGVFLPDLMARTKHGISSDVIASLTEAGLLLPPNGGANGITLQATERGMLLLNRLLEELAAGMVLKD
jgi:oxygen-independent coproporphyrinogen-3 oxidase